MYKLGFCVQGPNCRFRHVREPAPAPAPSVVASQQQQQGSFGYGGYSGGHASGVGYSTAGAGVSWRSGGGSGAS